jgi:hypothetical protein
MKSAGIWSSMKAIYPMVGASAAACAQNLKSSSFTGTFSSGWTFASTGVTPNGSSAYFNTTLVPNGNLTGSSTHVSYYSRTNTTTNAGVETGTWVAAYAYGSEMAINRSGVGTYIRLNSGAVGQLLISAQNSQAFFIGSRTATNSIKYYRNSTTIGTDTNSATINLSTFNTYFGASNDFGTAATFSTKECAFASIGDGLTDTQASNFYTAVQAFQTTLNRYVDAPWYNNGNLLLDTYPSAAAAYSVRKLRNNYIGGPIRVRRSSDNAEQDIYFDSNGNLDTAQLTSFCSGTNGFVTTWYDQSGNSINATNTTAANQPQIVSSGSVITQNSKPTIQGDGVNSFLRFSLGPTSVPVSTFYCVQRNSGTGYAYDWAMGSNFLTSLNAMSSGWEVATQNVFEWDGGAVNLDGSQSLNTFYLKSMLNLTGATKLLFFQNNVSKTIGQPSGSINTNGSGALFSDSQSGSSQRFAGNMSEFILYKSDQTTNVNGINTNINTYYGIY